MTPSRERDGVRPAWTRRGRRKPGGFAAVTACRLHVAFLICACVTQVAWAAPSPFYMGADISLETFMQQQNVHFADNRGQAPLDTIMYDHGANLFRLRIFVNPETTYTNTNSGAIQTTAYDIALAQQIKAHAPNAKILLDFMYSDTFADPGKQGKPAAWTNIPLVDPVNHNDLTTTIKNYTQNTLQAFGTAGVMPDMVQVGNEISSGMLWGTGTGTNAQGGMLSGGGQQTGWQNLGMLLNSAIQGVRAAQGAGPKIDVAIHIDQGDQGGHTQFYFGNLTNPSLGNVSDFDIIGVSYYPTNRFNHSLSLLQSNLNNSADSFPTKKIMVLETNNPWEASSFGLDPPWPKTPAGQQQFMIDLQNVMRNLHNGAGEGIVYWYPESVLVPGFSIYNSGQTALFDNSHNALPALSTFGITLVPGDVDHDGSVTLNDYAVLRDNFGMGPNARSFNGDLNRDGVVDLADFALWKDLYAAAGGAGAGAAGLGIPEPASAVLILMALPLLFRLGTLRLQRKRNTT